MGYRLFSFRNILVEPIYNLSVDTILPLGLLPAKI
jgi:hypothetical protein